MPKDEKAFDRHAPSTRESLIKQMVAGDEVGWQRFDEAYYEVLVQWARRRGLSHELAKDAVSELLVNFARYFKNFRYDPKQSFRGYLQTALKNCVQSMKLAEARQRIAVTLIEEDMDPPEKSGQSLLDVVIENEHHNLLNIAQQEILSEAGELERHAWIGIFIEPESAVQIAEEHGVSRATVYRVKTEMSERIKAKFNELSQLSRENENLS
ncbi:RNA polymerase sigma factor [Rhodopirellula bahusiensis]|uniref:RNA polymerase sigma factor n=1 Tax=Rhodopirellula bahusiensis TaxID=2014065 RepID=UPI003265D386